MYVVKPEHYGLKLLILKAPAIRGAWSFKITKDNVVIHEGNNHPTEESAKRIGQDWLDRLTMDAYTTHSVLFGSI